MVPPCCCKSYSHQRFSLSRSRHYYIFMPCFSSACAVRDGMSAQSLLFFSPFPFFFPTPSKQWYWYFFWNHGYGQIVPLHLWVWNLSGEIIEHRLVEGKCGIKPGEQTPSRAAGLRALSPPRALRTPRSLSHPTVSLNSLFTACLKIPLENTSSEWIFVPSVSRVLTNYFRIKPWWDCHKHSDLA